MADLRAFIRRLEDIEHKIRRSHGVRALPRRVLLRMVPDETEEDVLEREGLTREQLGPGAEWFEIEFVEAAEGRPAVTT